MPAPRKAVGIYDRPHPLRTRRVLVTAAVAAVTIAAYALWLYLA
ncbi:MAG: hypothetical protein ACM3JC_07550 [Rudaea sp.]